MLGNGEYIRPKQMNAQADAQSRARVRNLHMSEISTGHLRRTTSAKDQGPHMRHVFIRVSTDGVRSAGAGKRLTVRPSLKSG